MSYIGIKVYPDRTMEEIELNYEQRVNIDGQTGIPQYGNHHRFLLVYTTMGAPETKENINRIASAFYGARVYGVCVIVNSNIKEIPNENYVSRYYDSDDSDEEREEDEGQYITTREDLDLHTFKYMCRRNHIRLVN